MRVMKAQFGKSRKTSKKSREVSNSILGSRVGRQYKSNMHAVQIEEVRQLVKVDHFEDANGKCLLCDPDWCPVYKKRLCHAKGT